MNSTEKNVLIIVVVERGKTDPIVEAARKHGAGGATILFARGTGTQEHLSLFGINADSMKEVVMILAQETHVYQMVGAMTTAGRLTEPGTGILFTVPVGTLVGLEYRQTGGGEQG